MTVGLGDPETERACLDPAVAYAGLKHASARFRSPVPRSGMARRGRMARCRRSRPAATMTPGQIRVGCSVFLNNRYQDPQTGVFLSVDPLVARTGQAYLYAAGNPTTLSDPSGLMSADTCERTGQCSRGNAAGLQAGLPKLDTSTIGQVKVEQQFPGATSPAAPAGTNVNGGASGGWPVTPWVWQPAMACVAHSSPALQDAGCQVAGVPDTGSKAKPTLASCVLSLDCPFEQLKECTVGGAASFCSTLDANASEAEAFVLGLRGFSPTRQNAIMHAYWFALNRFDLAGAAGANIDGTLRTLGRDHEADWRDNYLDARKDEANNAIGILIGSQAIDVGLPRDQLGPWVVTNINVLFCVSNIGDQAYGAPSNC